MTDQVQNEEFIVVAYNNLRYNCQTDVGNGEYWPHYFLDSQENGEGCLYSEMLQDWEECEANDEEIVVSTPGISVPGWCGSCCVEWQLLKKAGQIKDFDYIEVGLIRQSDDASLKSWHKWYDSGFSETDPTKTFTASGLTAMADGYDSDGRLTVGASSHH